MGSFAKPALPPAWLNSANQTGNRNRQTTCIKRNAEVIDLLPVPLV